MDIHTVVLVAPVLLFSVIAHEYAHGYAALKQGDTTALSLGRLTWNPIKHIDPFMTILLPVVLAFSGLPILGGAKPVPVNPRNYRNYRRGDIIVSLAGVSANLLIAIGCAIVIVLTGAIGQLASSVAEPLGIVQAMCAWGVLINIELFFFNLLPIPPLDGSHVVKYLLPPAWAVQYERVGFFGIIVLLLLLRYNSRLLNGWLTFVIQGLGSALHSFLLPSSFQWSPVR